ncbi:MAG: hypothetical protein MZV70_44555 [Desulfobacterales bacterium]|nr:hypothetical protein [Desulfobacterales bacterium]
MKMRIGVVACESFRKEMDLLTEGDPDIVHKEYLEFGLHSYPQDLKRAVVEHVNASAGKGGRGLPRYSAHAIPSRTCARS